MTKKAFGTYAVKLNWICEMIEETKIRTNCETIKKEMENQKTKRKSNGIRQQQKNVKTVVKSAKTNRQKSGLSR